MADKPMIVRPFSRFTFHVSLFFSRLRASAFGNVNILQLRVPFHGRHAEVAADPALFEAAEWRLDMDAAMGIDAQHAAFDPAGEAQSAVQVVGPDRTAQA